MDELYAAKVVTVLDVGILALYAELMAEYAEAPRKMSAAKLTQLRLVLGELGFSPASRLKTPPIEDAPKELIPPSGGNVVTIADIRRSVREGRK